jgi:hypothetical protein
MIFRVMWWRGQVKNASTERPWWSFVDASVGGKRGKRARAVTYLNDIKTLEGNEDLDGGEDPRSTQLSEEWEGPREEVEGQCGSQVLRMRGVEKGGKIRGTVKCRKYL